MAINGQNQVNSLQTKRGTDIYSGIGKTNASSRATRRGTRIVKKGNELDKNAFLRILTAELKNQDPTNTKDSTQFVSQLAQFSSLEQMSNLNGTMSFSGAQGLVGKLVAFNKYDDMGRQYGGFVRNVTKNGDTIKVTAEVMDKGKRTIKEFNLSDVQDVIEYKDNTLEFINGNMGFLLASNMMNKKVEAVMYHLDANGEKVEEKYAGVVKGITRDTEGIKLRVLVKDGEKEEEKYIPYDCVVKVDNVDENAGKEDNPESSDKTDTQGA
ncbi:flagellar hook assembly protein FlgD [Haloimpatiens sp. FM7330]|uniref:flagellar hook assembly protein FlgD n=1 Tax=Haloimpatiens sp. FM7330 TaxID=3298610 RepID=UPI00362A270C